MIGRIVFNYETFQIEIWRTSGIVNYYKNSMNREIKLSILAYGWSKQRFEDRIIYTKGL
jgi:hypothetical protein